MTSIVQKTIGSGSNQLDDLLQGLQKGDNVVWLTERDDEYSKFAHLFARQTLKKGRGCIYFKFSQGASLLPGLAGLATLEINPAEGFDYFSRKINEVIEANGSKAYYIFDNLSALVDTWSTDELLADFYQITCPLIYEKESIAYFSITNNYHDYATIAKIKTTTQILISIYNTGSDTYIHPLKVWQRYSQHMFLPHLATNHEWKPMTTSMDASAAITASGKHLVRTLPDSDSPWNAVFKKLVLYRDEGLLENPSPEITALKNELASMLFGSHAKMTRLSEDYLTLEDLIDIRSRVIGSGQIGGKAAGMLIASNIISAMLDADFSLRLEKHDSFYIGSDVFFSFLVNNNLFRLRLNISKNPVMDNDEFENIERAFLKGKFPEETIEQFRDMLEHYGQAPIIVRSSSLLEDGFEHAYAGKYRSEFCANQGDPDERLENFLKAVKLVFASALNPDVLSYRKKMNITEGDEQMAILVQRVSGMPFKKYFFPTLAGVAFSRNLYAWTSRIDPYKGMIRLVFGLGTRAVNRISGDYPRMVAISAPELRPEAPEQIDYYSQKYIDLIDLEVNQFVTKPVDTVLLKNCYPNQYLFGSNFKEGYEQILSSIDDWQEGFKLTFRELIKRTHFVDTMDGLVSILEEAWGQPVDIEFTAHVDNNDDLTINLLQCRSLRLPRLASPDSNRLEKVSNNTVLFKSNRAIGSGTLDGIVYIVYIDPLGYASMNSMTRKQSLGRIIGKLNNILASMPGKTMLMGPGRWGSNNAELGINVKFSDIAGISALVEMAYEKAGLTPEVSYGTHFFLDLVEAEILYLPLYPDDAAACFNVDYFSNAPNIFPELLPEYVEYSKVIKIIDIQTASGSNSASATIASTGCNYICFLENLR